MPAALVAVATLGACGPVTPDPRVPLPIPLSAVEGASPAVSTGAIVGLSLTDGFWGPERERAELTGWSFGIALLDRVEIDVQELASNRSVDDDAGRPHSGSGATTVRGKVLVRESESGDWAFGVVGSRSNASRFVPGVQDETATAWDLALPVEYRALVRGADADPLAIYAAPRFIRKTFRSRATESSTAGSDTGVAWGGLLGLKARIGWVRLSAEGTLVRSPRLQVGAYGSRDGWMFIPNLGARLAVPIG